MARPGQAIPQSLGYECEARRTRFIGLRETDRSIYYSGYCPNLYPGIVPSLSHRGRTPSPRPNGRPAGDWGVKNPAAFTRWFEEAEPAFTLEEMKATLRRGRPRKQHSATRDELARCIDHMWTRPRIAEHYHYEPGLSVPGHFGQGHDAAIDHYKRTSCSTRTAETLGNGKTRPGLYVTSDVRPNTEALAAFLECDPTTVRALRKRGEELRTKTTPLSAAIPAGYGVPGSTNGTGEPSTSVPLPTRLVRANGSDQERNKMTHAEILERLEERLQDALSDIWELRERFPSDQRVSRAIDQILGEEPKAA